MMKKNGGARHFAAPGMRREKLNVRLPESLTDRAKEAAIKRGEPLTTLVERAVLRELEELGKQ